MKKLWKSTTYSLLAASLLFTSQAAFAQGKPDKSAHENNAQKSSTSEETTSTDETTLSDETTVSADDEATVTSETYTDSSVNVDKLTQKLEKIKEKYNQFVSQEGPVTAQAGKLGSIQNRVNALKAQLGDLDALQQEVQALDGADAEAAVDTLTQLYSDLGEFENALHVQQDYVQKLKDASDEQLLKEYKEIGKLLKKMGKVGVKALVNGVEPEMDVEPMIEDGRTLVPFRALAEALGAQVEWNPETRTVTVTKDNATVVLTIDQMTATVDGKEYTLDVPAKIVKGRTVVPLRFLSEGLKAKVLWDQETLTAGVVAEVAPNDDSTAVEESDNATTDESTTATESDTATVDNTTTTDTDTTTVDNTTTTDTDTTTSDDTTTTDTNTSATDETTADTTLN